MPFLPSIRLVRMLPPETAHNLSIWALRTGVYRVGFVIDALFIAVWAYPSGWLLRWCERYVARRSDP